MTKMNNEARELTLSELDLVVGGSDVRIGQVSSTVGSGSGSDFLQNLLSSIISGLNQAASNQRHQQQDRSIPQ
jgi:hypothetical protein